jgi:RimJ/RimL family protein N-acetyltransferase
VLLRNVRVSDLAVYLRIYCDPVMMAELGGPLPVDRIPDRLMRNALAAASDEAWCRMIVPDEADPDTIAGFVTLYSHSRTDNEHKTMSEIGWAVLTEFQQRGIGKTAVRLVLEQARDDGRWGLVHALPSVTNPASNGICRTLGFTLTGQEHAFFNGMEIHSNHWQIDPQALPDHGTSATAT